MGFVYQNKEKPPRKIVAPRRLLSYDIFYELKYVNLIFSVGKSFEDYMVQSAMENPDVQFCVADGEQAQTNQLNNLHSYSMKEFEARFVAGVAAGLKLKDMIQDNELSASDAIVGYIGEEDNPENVSAYSTWSQWGEVLKSAPAYDILIPYSF